MKQIRKIITVVCMALIVAVQTAFPAFAESGDIGRIFDYFTAESGGFYDGLEFGENDWAAYCRIRLYGTGGAEEYLQSVREAAEELMQSDGFVKPTELQRAAIVLAAAGMCDEALINAAVYHNDKLDRQGINAYIWALIAANCCGIPAPEDAVNTKGSLAQHLISKQLSDGGFALKGEAADTDITAEVVYALAPLCEDKEISEALQRAEQCLFSLQLESGGYSSMGVENCESSAQAIMAFCALGYDDSDSRVAKALAALMEYQTDDGGFSHIGGEAGGIPAVQTLQALTALELSERGETLFCISERNTEQSETTDSEVASEAETQEATASGDDIRMILAAISASAGVTLIVVWLVRGRKRMLLIAAGAAALALALVIMLLDIRTPEEYYSQRGDEKGMTVTVLAECREAIEAPEKSYTDIELPENGYIIAPVEITVPQGSAAFDALVEASRELKLTVDHSASAMGVYVSGIGPLYEFDYGSESGWLYYVNDERPSMASSEFRLSDGDEVRFSYTTHLSY